MSFTPTSEQQQAIELAKQGRSIAIKALAGTGKTATLVKISDALAPQIVQFIAFNSDIVRDATPRFGSNARCNTAHQLAHRATPRELTGKLNRGKRQPSWDIADAIGLREGINVINWEGNRKQLSRGFLAGLVMRSVEKWCQSADPEPTYQHVPAIVGLDSAREKGKRGSGLKKGAAWQEVAQQLVPYIKRAWQDLNSPHGSLRYDHCHYLKRWQLSDPKIAADVILWDEAQDASPVMMDIISKQTHAQVIWVGDDNQEIYAWAGAVNAMEKIESDNVTYLTKSFRFGQAVADEANRVLAMLGVEQKVVGFEKVDSTVGEIEQADAILCRSNARVVQNLFAELDAGRRPAIVGGGKEIKSFCRAAEKLMNNKRVEHPELAMFENWDEVQDYVEQDAQGGDLALMVKIIDEFGVARILELLDSVVDARDKHVQYGRDYDVAVSTAHKSKGREWNRVKLADDFPAEIEKASAEELRLLYVAVTRAKLALDITAVALLSEGAAVVERLDRAIEEIMDRTETQPEPVKPEPVAEFPVDTLAQGRAGETAAAELDEVTPIVEAARALVAANDRDFEKCFAALEAAVKASEKAAAA